MHLHINHVSRYHYDTPVHYALQQLRLTPKRRKGQNVITWSIAVEGGKKELRFEDQHSNSVDLISIGRGEHEIIITCTGEVELTDSSGVIGKHGGHAPLWYFQNATELTRPGREIRRLVSELRKQELPALEQAHTLSQMIRDAVTYSTGETHAETSAEEALKLGEGVCQDHSHIFVSAARLLGFPARYVSGYLMMDDRVEQDATHGWAEAHIDGLGWVGFDISNGYSPDERYVRVATGLDYREAAPISGMRYGHGMETLSVELQVQQ
ncbi:transglutaminase family protein [Alterisphingorhabdus coralli]|uniref:Transglutaminase family protein n=1 Tax=Alterisphingorhabdus coralli TaxID=3071408 RepID=A0AA97F8L4_9SPHN|nr:transglutaminase family protein [Parasphingorhabdus sp. SCSIO 66989]WOE76374.1 transglutaminase family protein [Parasphingorhabdus sp. SCSIO 66989]